MSAAIYSQAKTWLGTRFVHQGRLKKGTAGQFDKGGVDCLGLLMGVALELGLKSRNGNSLINYDNLEYSMIPDGLKLKGSLAEHLHQVSFWQDASAIAMPVNVLEQINCGDILLFKLDGNPQHLAIAGREGESPTIIHAYLEAKKVVINSLAPPWTERLQGVYRLNIEDKHYMVDMPDPIIVKL